MSEARQEYIEKLLAGYFADNSQPDMSGDQRNRLLPHKRRLIEDCARDILRAPDPRIAAARALAEASMWTRSDLLSEGLRSKGYPNAARAVEDAADLRAALLEALEAGGEHE